MLALNHRENPDSKTLTHWLDPEIKAGMSL